MFSWKFKRLPARWGAILVPFLVSLLMSGIISFIATLKTVGFSDRLVSAWLGAWELSWVIAFPALLILLPLVRRFVGHLVEPATSGR